MPHEDIYRNGQKLVSATTLPSILAKSFLDTWRLKLCHCVTHASCDKSKLKPKELEAITKIGSGHCGYVYGDQVRDDAGDLGTEVHELIDNWFKGLPVEGSEEAMVWADKIVELYKAHDVKPHIVKPEETLIDAESGLNGSPDHPILWDGLPVIADLKIKNQLDDFTGVQGYIYRYLIHRKYNFDFRHMLVIWCKKGSKSQIVEPVMIDLDEWKSVTEALVVLWNRMNPKRQITLFPLEDK